MRLSPTQIDALLRISVAEKMRGDVRVPISAAENRACANAFSPVRFHTLQILVQRSLVLGGGGHGARLTDAGRAMLKQIEGAS